MNHVLKIISILILVLSIYSCSKKEKVKIPNNNPNFLVIMLDDLGYTDLGCYGGEINTPNIDSLAYQGVRFTNFKTAAMCAPTRSRFLSGNYNTVAGHGRMFRGKIDSFYYNKKGYEFNITDRVVVFPKLLQETGYYNCISGKWHLGFNSDPKDHGFDDSWILINGYSNHFNNIGINLNGTDTLQQYKSNGKKVSWPKNAFSTEFYTDQMIKFLGNAKTKNKPFFAWVSYTAPHWPLQLPKNWLDKKTYKSTYIDGHEVLRQKRFTSMKEKGIVPATMELPPPMKSLSQWEQFSDTQKKYETRKMEIYAGMVENTDFHIGRLIQTLKNNKQLENTIVLLISDNGASGHDFYNHPRGKYARELYNNEYDNLGSPTSFVGLGPHWANAQSGVFLGYKTWASEAGITVPFIISGGNFIKSNLIKTDLLRIEDIAPTILELANVSYPIKRNNKQLKPMTGKSFANYLTSKSSNGPHTENTFFASEDRGHAYVRKGDWKIVNFGNAHNNKDFQLFNLKEDLGERKNVKNNYPEITSELINYWENFKEEMNVIFPPSTSTN